MFLNQDQTGQSPSIVEPDHFIQAFSRAVQRFPDAPAVKQGSSTLSYAELDRLSDQLALALTRRGIGPEQFVALMLTRSPAMVIGVLGILKAGAAYLPIDPAYPIERRRYMVDDARPALLITETAEAESEAEQADFLVGLELPTASMSELMCGAESHVSNSASCHSKCPAYLIYTSGSTGRPKGVVVTHEGIINLAMSQIKQFAVTSESRVLQFASLSFDAAFSEISMSLLSGACLVLARRDQLLAGIELERTLIEQAISHVTLPPSSLTALGADASDRLVHLKTLAVAGEPCPSSLVEAWGKNRLMINAYGPTEATVCATMSDHLISGEDIPLGAPLHGIHLYLLDEFHEPVPHGHIGEIYIAGPGLARGYLGNAALTAEKFVPCPFLADGSRMYRSGDLAMITPAGQLLYRGRRDQQVKLRGYRIELGEIERVLESHAHVSQACVVIRANHDQHVQMHAYVTARPAVSKGLCMNELRSWLRLHLPDYMTPASLSVMPAFPQTANGKIDRAAISNGVTKACDSTQGSKANANAMAGGMPADRSEAALLTLYGEILQCGPIALDQSFFDLGGDSLMATRLISRIRATLGVELTLDDIFDAPTIADLAALLPAAPKARVSISTAMVRH